MTPHILEWLATVKTRFTPHTGRVLEIGSCNVNGTPRSVFTDAESYLGIDIAPGRNVDQVIDPKAWRISGQFDLVICCEVLEHDPDPLATLKHARYALSPGGVLIVTSPANGFPLHRYPRDYWRLMPDAYADLIFKGMDVLEIVAINGPTNCGAGRRR